MRGLELGKNNIHFTSELFEDTLQGWGLGAAQDAGDRTRLLEALAPSS